MNFRCSYHLKSILLSRMWGTFALLIAFIVFYFMFKRLTEQKVDMSKGPFQLQSKPEVADSSTTRQLLNATNTGTIQAFVYPLQAQKTGTMVLCNPTGSANPGEPECSTGQYNLCKCVGNDCSKCIHSGYVNVLNISNVIRLEILASPDAGRPNAATAQLVVRTLGMASPEISGCPNPTSEFTFYTRLGGNNLGNVKICCNTALNENGWCPDFFIFNVNHIKEKICLVGNKDTMDPMLQEWFTDAKACVIPNLPRVQTVFEETIPLPEIPFQKWTFVTIAREGRRFDVYYNGKVVMSKRTQHIVDSRSGFGPIMAGDPNLIGKLAFVQTFPEKLNQSDILSHYKANSDTTGQPVISAPTNLFDYLPNCKDGGCISGPKMRPTSPLLDWKTQYA